MLMEKFGGKVFEVSGNIADPYFAGLQGHVVRPQMKRKGTGQWTWKLLNSHAFVVLKLTGEVVVDYGVAGLNAPFFDQKQLKWSGEMIEGCGMDTDKFPCSALLMK